jgi:toxin ParE1/3/4
MDAQVTLRERATQDGEDAVQYFEAETPPGTAEDFVDGLEQALKHLSRHPLTGSLRYAFELGIPELRTWPLRRFPYLIFYIADREHVDIWRIMHAHRDIPASFAQQQPDPDR